MTEDRAAVLDRCRRRLNAAIAMTCPGTDAGLRVVVAEVRAAADDIERELPALEREEARQAMLRRVIQLAR